MTMRDHAVRRATGAPARISRRGLLRRSAVGLAAIGATGVLAACGDDDGAGDPDEVMDNAPLDADSTPVENIEIGPETVEDEAGD